MGLQRSNKKNEQRRRMIEYTRTILENGLRVLVHEDKTTPLVAVNVLYNVGAKDESPDKTGFAHLFEHLMFGGSTNIKDYDGPIQLAGGDCNAFTNSDLTNFYQVLPVENIETALWLESDRMLSLDFNQKSLEVQRKVVLEEFNETCLNKPYGDAWHHLSSLAYKKHPYRWPTIGLVPKHIEDANLEDVESFFFSHYRPNNAILVFSGNISEEKALNLTKKWFEDIPKSDIPKRNLPQEPKQDKLQKKEISSNVPIDALYMAFHMPDRLHEDYYAIDLLSDVICNGRSSRFYKSLYKEQKIFSSIDAYITGSIDPGLLVIEGRLNDGFTLEFAEQKVWEELDKLKKEGITELELQKYKNKVESNIEFSEASILNKAINLAFFELIGKPEMVNTETSLYNNVTIADVERVAHEILVPENCSELFYKSETSKEDVQV